MEIGDVLVVQFIRTPWFARKWNIEVGDQFCVTNFNNSYDSVEVASVKTPSLQRLTMGQAGFRDKAGNIVKKKECLWR